MGYFLASADYAVTDALTADTLEDSPCSYELRLPNEHFSLNQGNTDKHNYRPTRSAQLQAWFL